MKEQIQELHRDITRRKCLSKKEAVADILDECSQVDIQVNTQMATLEHMKLVFMRVGLRNLYTNILVYLINASVRKKPLLIS